MYRKNSSSITALSSPNLQSLKGLGGSRRTTGAGGAAQLNLQRLVLSRNLVEPVITHLTILHDTISSIESMCMMVITPSPATMTVLTDLLESA